jgi:undecaprenyl-diphosphatase
VRQPVPLVALCLAVIAALGVVVRGDNAVTRWDRDVVADVAADRGAGLVDVARALTNLGDGLVLAILLLLVGAALTATRVLRPAAAFAPALSLAAGAALAPILKAIFERPRPPVALHEVVERTSGYPSGHSTQSAAGWLALGLVLTYAATLRTGPSRGRWPLVVCGLIVLVVGVSRVVLSVHSPTDVLAGWLLGLACAVVVVGVLVRDAGGATAADGVPGGPSGTPAGPASPATPDVVPPS